MADENDNAELSLPVARVRRIVRSDPEVKIIAADALYLITKATVRLSRPPTPHPALALALSPALHELCSRICRQ